VPSADRELVTTSSAPEPSRQGRRALRLRRGSGRDPRDGETVIRAVVHARLLGIRLLTLDACVVVGPPDLGYDANDPLTTLSATTDGHRWTTADSSAAAARLRDPAPGLAQAVALLEEGAHTLAHSRRLAR
jgi:hypothetical protein